MTNPARLPGLRHLDKFAWKRKLPSIYRDFAKTTPAPTQTATPHTTGPLGLRFQCNTVIANAQARAWQLATATASAAAKHMLLCQPRTTI